MVVGVVERWCRVEVEERQTPDAIRPRQQLVVLRDRARALLVGAGEQDRDRVHFLSGQPADPAFGSGCAGVAEDVRAGCHSFAELVGKGGKRLLGHAERAKAIPRERQRDPAIRAIHTGLRIRRRLHLVKQLGQPRPATCGGVERQELVAPGDRRRAGQQDVLDVVELEHYCIWSSMSENAAFSRSAFLISSAVAYGYSPYSRKLGHWCSRTNLMNASGFSFQSSGKPSRLVKTVVIPVWLNSWTASSVYLSKSVSKMPWYWKCRPDPTSNSTHLR